MKASEFSQYPELGTDYWGEVADHSLEDWQYEVANDDTRLGYWDWVLVMKEQDDRLVED